MPSPYAYAEGFDTTTGRYKGLRCGESTAVSADGTDLLVKPEAAARQLDADDRCDRKDKTDSDDRTASGGGETAVKGGDGVAVATRKARRFHGTVTLDTLRTSRDIGQITQEVIQHLSGLVGADVELTLEIHAEVPDGVPDHVIRAVTENCRTLRFRDFGFEEE